MNPLTGKSMRYVTLIALFAVATLWMSPAPAVAQEADTIRIGADRVVIVIDDSSLVVRRADRAAGTDDREIRIERRDRPGTFRMMRRQGAEGDTLQVDVDRMVRRARAMAEVPLAWIEEFEAMDRPLGAMMDERREIARLETEARDLARRARSASGAERAEHEANLRTTLDELLDRRLDLERQRVDRLEADADERRERLERRQANRAEILERRFRDLMGDDDLDW